MLNTIREYIVTAQSQLQMYATPVYMQGRKEDIKVEVDGVSVSDSHYELNSNSLNFKADHQPEMGARVKIYRQTSHDTRLAQFTDGSLLKADTLDLSAAQLFNMAQEAFDRASYTQIGGNQFYHASDQPPTGIKQGALWYDISPSVNELKVWDGEDWFAVAPLVENYALTLADRAFLHSVAASPITINAHVFNVPNLANSTTVFLNGVRLTGWENTEDAGADPLDAFNDGDVDWVAADIADDGYKRLYIAGTITSGDVITVTTVQGGYASTVKNVEEQAKTYRDEAKYWAEQADSVETSVALNVDALQNFAVSPKDQSFIYDGETFYSALHYADIATTAASTAAAAVAQTADAYLYASHPENTQYTDSANQTGYSALHYKNKAEEAASTASESADNAINTLGSVNAVKDTVDGVKDQVNNIYGDVLITKANTDGAFAGASSHRDAAGLSKILAQKHANSDVAFDDDGTTYKSAKMHTEDAVAAVADVGGLIVTAEALEDSLKSTINNPANVPISIDGESPFYSARHYAVLAETAANQTVDNLVGWDLVDANTISTNTTGAPVIHSGTTLDIKATDAVRANDVPLPFLGGSLSFDTNNHKGFKNQTITKVSNTWRILFDTPFDYTLEYSVIATYAGSGNNTVRVSKSTDKIELSVFDTLGNSIDTGEIAVTLYKFT